MEGEKEANSSRYKHGIKSKSCIWKTWTTVLAYSRQKVNYTEDEYKQESQYSEPTFVNELEHL